MEYRKVPETIRAGISSQAVRSSSDEVTSMNQFISSRNGNAAMKSASILHKHYRRSSTRSAEQ